MKKLKTYENFEIVGKDENVEAEIDKILFALVKQKVLISMLRDTSLHVVNTIKKILPSELDEFTNSLRHYEHDVYLAFEKIRENLIDGYPNLEDLMEDMELEFTEIEEYLKAKFPNT